MKKLFILAALFMATTSADAGSNGISFEIEGQKIRIEAPRHCESLSCIKISAPGFKGLKSRNLDDDWIAGISSPAAIFQLGIGGTGVTDRSLPKILEMRPQRRHAQMHDFDSVHQIFAELS